MFRSNAVRIVVALLTALFAVAGHAQVITGTILGRVTDTSNSALPGVTVSLKNVDVGQTRTVVTDPDGNYRASGLTIGKYEVRAELSGFQPKVRSGITLNVGNAAVVNFTLGLAAMTEAIVVHGEAPMVNTTESTMSYVVDERKIRDLPLNGFDQ